MAARRANSLCITFVAQRHSLLCPHWKQSRCLLVTPAPHLLQGWERDPLRSFTRWALQKFARQLWPQSLVEPTVNHWHVSCPLGIMLAVYQRSPPSLNGSMLRDKLLSGSHLGWGPARGAGVERALLVRTRVISVQLLVRTRVVSAQPLRGALLARTRAYIKSSRCIRPPFWTTSGPEPPFPILLK